MQSFLEGEVSRGTLDKILLEFNVSMPYHHFHDVTLEIYEDRVADHLVTQLKVYVYGVQHIEEYVTYPETWVDAVKVRFFPKWLLKRYPGKMVSKAVTITRICPHLNMKAQGRHLDWVAWKPKKRRPPND